MPRRKEKNAYVTEDGQNSRIPAYSEEAFQKGINFVAKYIGSLDMPRPQTRLDIVSAMRRVRYESRAKSIKKKKVVITISVDGIYVNARRKKKFKTVTETPKKFILSDSSAVNDKDLDISDISNGFPEELINHHFIHRIFYVSHDSQDMKIFSYIARDGNQDEFKCSVFKSYKKMHAVRIVRTLGQAFDVCHRLTLQKQCQEREKSAEAEKTREKAMFVLAEDSIQPVIPVLQAESDTANNLSDTPPAYPSSRTDTQLSQGENTHCLSNAQKRTERRSFFLPLTSSTQTKPETITSTPNWSDADQPSSADYQVAILRRQLEQETHHTQTALIEVRLLKEKLAAEVNARLSGQSRIHELLSQNRELIDQLNQLVHRIQELEKDRTEDTPSTPGDPFYSRGFHVVGSGLTSLLPSPYVASNYETADMWTSFLARSPLGNPMARLEETSAPCSDHSRGSIDQGQHENSPSVDEIEDKTNESRGVNQSEQCKSLVVSSNRNPDQSSSGKKVTDASLIDQLYGDLSLGSPDSGHKEMSADSLSQALTFSEAYPSKVSYGSVIFAKDE